MTVTKIYALIFVAFMLGCLLATAVDYARTSVEVTVPYVIQD